MPVITDLKRQKRADQRFNVYLDCKYAFALSDLDVSNSGLRVGQQLSETEVAELRSHAEAQGAYAKALRFLGVRIRSRREMQDYLRRKGVPDEQITDVAGRLERAGLLDDRAFAAAWIANRRALRPRSKRQLERELLDKGVARDDVAAALEEFEPEAELEALVDLAAKKRRLSQYHDPEKLMAYLARQGYPYDRIKKALEVLAERSVE